MRHSLHKCLMNRQIQNQPAPVDNCRVPFTLAHAAAAIPFRRMRLVPSALIVGTFAPDCEYFVRLGPSGGYGHTHFGAVLVSLPLGLLVLLLFHALVKAPAFALLPQALHDRLLLERFRFGGTSRFALILVSLMVGIATHIGWDNFTHRNLWLYWHWPLLQQSVHVAGIGSIPVYKGLQHLSTVGGLLILLIWFRQWHRTTQPVHQAQLPRLTTAQKLVFSVAILAIAMALALVRAAYGARHPYEGHVLRTFAGDAICTFVAACWLQLVFLGVLVTRWKSSRVPAIAATLIRK